MHALMIEPNRHHQAIFTPVLENCDFHVTQANNDKEALVATKQQNFDIICMSMSLPDMDAPQLCMRFRATDATLHTPIVMLTSESDQHAFQNALVAGATEVFHKNELSQFEIYLDHLQARRLKDATISGNILYIEDE